MVPGHNKLITVINSQDIVIINNGIIGITIIIIKTCRITSHMLGAQLLKVFVKNTYCLLQNFYFSIRKHVEKKYILINIKWLLI